MKKIAFALLLHASTLVAQQGATAELSGSVTSDGQRLPGVTVSLTSPSLQGIRSATTGTNGGYRFGFLPPGDYALRFELQGFTSVQKTVHVGLTETVRADAELGIAALNEEMVVKAQQGRPDDAAIVLNLRSTELERLPGTHDIRSNTLLSSSTSALGNNGGLLISGAPSWDSLFVVDGVVANEYLSGQPINVVLEDSIQEVSILSGAISAEYGRFTGGVVSAITKSGGNALSGSIRDRITNTHWTRRTPWPVEPSQLDKTNHAVEATLGGFVMKDRLWFFLASRNAATTLQRYTNLTNIAYHNGANDRRWEGKLTGQITPQQTLIASYATSTLNETNVTNFRSAAPLDLGALIPRRSQLSGLLALTYNGVVASNTSFESQFSQKRYALRGNGGQSVDPILGTAIVTRQGVMNAPIGCGICGDDARNSRVWSLKTSHYQDTHFGNHTATLGAEGFHEARTNAGTRSASEFNIQTMLPNFAGASVYPVFTASTFINLTHHDPADQGSNLNTYSAWANDRWDVTPRASFNVGLRYDRNHASDAIGRLISNDAGLSPRIGAKFDLRSNGRQQLFLSYGRYSAQLLEGGGNSQQVGVFQQFGWKYVGPVINGSGVPPDQLLPAPEALRQLFAWFASVGGTANRQYLQFITSPDASSIFHGSLKSPSVDESTIGYAVQLRNGAVRADYIRRDWLNFYAFRADRTTGQQLSESGLPLDIAWVINDNRETVRAYRAIELQGTWRYRSLTAGGGYTWSRLWGNDEEEEGVSVFQPRNLPLSLWYPELLGYPQRRPIGYLQQDERNRARVWLAYQAGSFSASVLQWFDSGHPYSAVAILNTTSVVANPGYVLNQFAGGGPYYFSRRGEFRTDDVFSTDVSLKYELPVRSGRLFVKADVLNLFNKAAIVSTDTAVSLLAAFDPFKTVPVRGVNYQLSPTFGEPTGPGSYQTPRTLLIAIGARF